MLGANLKYLRESKKLTQGELATLFDIGRTTYINYEKENSDPTSSILLKMANYYDVNTHDLLTEDLGAPLFHQKPKESDSILSDNIRILPITVKDTQKQNIEFVPAKAIAGYVTGMKEENYISELPRFHLPKLPEGTYRAFEIQGDSMPPIQDGYIVVGKYIEHAREITNGSRYVLVIKNEGVVFKKVISEIKDKKQLILASDNMQFQPYTVPITQVLEAWEFVAFIGFPNEVGMDYFMLDKLSNIEQQLSLLSSRKLK